MDSYYRSHFHQVPVLHQVNEPKVPHFTTSPSSSAFFKLDLLDDEIPEIVDVLNTEPFSNLPYEKLKNSAFKQDFFVKRFAEYDKKMEYYMEEHERLPLVDHELLEDYKTKLKNKDFITIFNQRSTLPIYKRKNEIIDLVENNQVVLLSGDTGCGKTTQVPQFLLDHYINTGQGSMCKIICTQPRRISAIAVAERVAEERAEIPGISSGYQVRVEKKIPRKHGSILFATNGIVLRFLESNPALNGISHLILDEIHERDIHTDFLLAMVKQIIKRRSDLKVVLMSATMNEQRFKEYFDNCPHVKIDRMTYDVKEFYLEDVVKRLNYRFTASSPHRKYVPSEKIMSSFRSYVLPYVAELERSRRYSPQVCSELQNLQSEELNVELIFDLTRSLLLTENLNGAILIFVTGYEEIKKLKAAFQQRLDAAKFLVITLHSQIPMEEQKEVFDKAPPGVRKIVISTNVAETSVTINDVVCVIDSGWAKVKTYDARTKTENLEAKFISKANAIQRKGRAGRTQPGVCYRLYTRGRFDAFFPYPKAELLRSRLEDVILQTKLLGYPSAAEFFKLTLDQPNPFIVERSLDILREIGAFEDEELLSPLGYYLAKLPISPQVGKILLLGVIFRCLNPILNIVVGLDYKSPFLPNSNLSRNQPDRTLNAFSEGCRSDHLLIHKALYLFQLTRPEARKKFCDDNNLNIETMNMLVELKLKFMEHLHGLELVQDTNPEDTEINSNSTRLELVKSIVCAGLYPNIGLSRYGPTYSLLDNTQIGIHKKSVIYKAALESLSIMAFYVKLKAGKLSFLYDCTVASPISLFFFNIKHNHLFSSSEQTMSLMKSLKQRLDQYLIYKMTNPGTFTAEMPENEERFLRVMVLLLSNSKVTKFSGSTLKRKHSASDYGWPNASSLDDEEGDIPFPNLNIY